MRKDKSQENKEAQVRENKEAQVSIKWAADDPSIHKFTPKPRQHEGEDQENAPPLVTYTVASYFLEKYGIRLKYPKMPIVCTGKGPGNIIEWFPIEFLFQSFGEMKNSNSPEQVQDVLKFYDEFSGTDLVRKVESLTKNRRVLESQRNFLKLFGIAKSLSPVSLKARVLEEPILQFKNASSDISDGSWNLRGVKFDSPATMASFGVIDFTSSGGRLGRGTKFFSNILISCRRHGIHLPFNLNPKDESSVVEKVAFGGNINHISESFSNAIEKAKDFFWYDNSRFYTTQKIWHKTRALQSSDGKGEWEDVLLIPPPSKDMKEFGIIYSGDSPTHFIKHNGTNSMARLMVKAFIKNEEKVVDPYDLVFDGQRYLAIIRDRSGNETSRELIEHLGDTYRLEDGTTVDHIECKKPCNIVGENLIQPISIVFVFLQDDAKKNYHEVKKMSHSTFGIPSQCIVKFLKFESRPEQYCSNIALKINTKLSNSSNEARAWKTLYKVPGSEGSSGIPWLSEAPTLVLGFSVSHGLGEDSKSIIAGHVALDPGCMQFAQAVSIQTKSGVISKEIIGDLTQTLLEHFIVHTGLYPARVLVYRDGVSEGDFARVLENECKVIRNVCFKNLPNFSQNEECQEKASIFNSPPITFIVCQTQHNIRIVPERPVLRHGNVFSGTCVDSKILDVKDSLLTATKDIPREPSKCFEDPRDDGYDFLLTSQGGLKGTSKPVMYRVLLNENVVWRPQGDCRLDGSPLSKEKLQLCTFHMAFQYGTATKAVRDVPVVKYSKRLAGNILGYYQFMEASEEVKKIGQVLDEIEVTTFETKNRDGITSDRYRFVSTEPNESKRPNNILHKLSPYDYKLGVVRPPAFPHNSA
eukprot:CAMPEP_0194288282 /NCGR_PEP_ID=MMETSP0169-20130528/36486_1 /TAXON_ID=218684 /ORGANISM="Corethron pennatum, Strain L29A3" /LENGTH=864 /DNA_ID=CAMNT_0039035237 /DNA_START=14 /DNA_END=2608 /DNA_ORIENTATION=+